MTTLQLRLDEEALVGETVEAIPLSEGLKLNRVYLGEDHDGDPTWFV